MVSSLPRISVNMAEEEWKEGIKNNFSTIIKNVANPDDLVEYFHHTVSPPLLNDDQVRKILDGNKTKREKTRSLIQTLMYGDARVLSELVKGLRTTKNETVAKLLEPYEENLRKERKKKLHLPPEVWPPKPEELEKMHKAEAELCDIAGVSKFGYDDPSEVYTMTAKRRGLAVIINNSTFDPKNLSYRQGTDLDRDKLSRVLSQLHFSVRIYNNVTSQDMIRIAQENSEWEHHRDSDCFVFTILSHGCSTGIYGTDGGVVPVKDIVINFNNVNCPKLTRKPKIFIFQACRSFESSETPIELPSQIEGAESGNFRLDCEDGLMADSMLEGDGDRVMADSSVDARPTTQIPKSSHIASDFFYAYATPEGFKSYRQEKTGSWFIQSIVWVLKYNAHEENLLDLITKVNRYVSTAGTKVKLCQVSQKCNTLLKRLYFFPGVFNIPPEKNDYIEEPVTVK